MNKYIKGFLTYGTIVAVLAVGGYFAYKNRSSIKENLPSRAELTEKVTSISPREMFNVNPKDLPECLIHYDGENLRDFYNYEIGRKPRWEDSLEDMKKMNGVSDLSKLKKREIYVRDIDGNGSVAGQRCR